MTTHERLKSKLRLISSSRYIFLGNEEFYELLMELRKPVGKGKFYYNKVEIVIVNRDKFMEVMR
jgi:hypothetical protein